MSTPRTRPRWATATRTIGWLAVAVAAFYALYAISAATAEILSLTGTAPATKPRSVPPIFILHAITGAVALVTGAVQLRLGQPRTRARLTLHRALGRSYVVSAAITSVGGAVIAVAFDVGPVGTVAFMVWASSWFAATATALHHIRRAQVQQHRRWAVRSYALAAVFVTFDFVRQALVSAGLPPAVVYPVAIAVCTGAHAAAAEWWIRTRLPQTSTATIAYPTPAAGH